MLVVYVHALMTQKSCAVGMRNAILRNHLNHKGYQLQSSEPIKTPGKHTRPIKSEGKRVRVTYNWLRKMRGILDQLYYIAQHANYFSGIVR